MKIVNFRIDEDEHKLICAICESAGHTVSSYIRAHFKAKAIELGIAPDPLHELRVSVKKEPANAEQDKPRVSRVPIPQGPNAWRDEIYRRVKDGEAEQAVADSYGVSLQVVKGKLKSAEHERQIASMPVYAPVDPDNPTLAEQKANAERARIQLEGMGFKV